MVIFAQRLNEAQPNAFLAIAGDLFSITRSEKYEQAIRKYFDHPNEQVRWWAEHALGEKGRRR